MDEMFTILKTAPNPQGVGLAAPQVGLDKRLFILLEDGHRQVFVNPKIVKTSKKLISDVYTNDDDRWLEGCLSIPKIWGFVDRPHQVTLDYQTLDLKSKIYDLTSVHKDFADVEAAYIQHEIDHLNGILFTDHILKQQGQILQETPRGLVPVSLLLTP